MKIDWIKIWDDFENWWNREEESLCSECGHILKDYFDWEEQQKKIQRLVNKQIKERK